VFPDPTLVEFVWVPYDVVVPYWKKYVVDWPFGFTVPLSVALDLPTSLVELVVTAGGLAAADAEVGCPAEMMASVSRPKPTNTIAAATRVLRMLPPFVSVQYIS
jgi:hypothetical protein